MSPTMTPSDVLILEVETDPPAGKYKNPVKNTDGTYGGYFWNSLTGEIDANPTGLVRARYTHATGAAGTWQTERFAVTPGRYVFGRFRHEAGSHATIGGSAVTLNGQFVFLDAAGATISTAPATGAGVSPGADVTTGTGSSLVPAGAVNARFQLYGGNAVGSPTMLVGQWIEFTRVAVIEKTTNAVPVWATALVDGPTWVSILGPTVEIEVDRQALDLGTLVATVRDATLDPLTVPTIRLGRACRLQAKHATLGTWVSVFDGELSDFDVQYEAEVLARNLGDPKHCRIEVEALDATRILASVRRPNGAKSLAALRDTLEDVGVPWNVNGDRRVLGVAQTPYVSYNDRATALDQVAIARDSYGALAWVDRLGTLQVWDRSKLLGFTNGGVTANIAGWSVVGSTAASNATRSIAFATVGGVGALAITTVAGPLDQQANPATDIRITRGHPYTLTVQTRAAATPRQARIRASWIRGSDGAVLAFASQASALVTNSVSGWTTHTLAVDPSTIPPDAAYLRATVEILGTVAGEVQYVRALTGKNGEVVLDQNTWSRIAIGGGSKSVVNEVTIEFLRVVDAVTTETVLYGPYRDEVSVRDYGVRSRKYTVNAPVAVAGEGAFALALAQGVFAANATPKAQASGVVVPVKTAADLTFTKALGDLGQLAGVSFAAKAYAADLRVNTLKHTIKADAKRGARWLVEYGFEGSTSVAAPRPAPTDALPVGDVQGYPDQIALTFDGIGYNNVMPGPTTGQAFTCRGGVLRGTMSGTGYTTNGSVGIVLQFWLDGVFFAQSFIRPGLPANVRLTLPTVTGERSVTPGTHYFYISMAAGSNTSGAEVAHFHAVITDH
jgi:hypothetical protein